MSNCSILLISRDSQLVDGMGRVARDIGDLELAVVGGLEQAYTYTGWEHVGLVLIHHDRRSTTMGVIRLLRMLAAARRTVATVVLADEPDGEEMTELLRRGAADLLPRPFDMVRLAYLSDVLTLRMRRPNVTVVGSRSVKEKEVLATWDETDPMIAQAKRIAPIDTTVLIQGEAGTGKSRLARVIHEMSPRKAGPFVTIRCSSLAPDGLAQELFGREFDATSRGLGSGRLAEAREGSLLLDDVDTLSPRSQAALVDWIEYESHRPSLSADQRPTRPRLLATVRGALSDAVTEGRFRSDLFYRLNVVGVSIVPLRQRRSEIAEVAGRLLEEMTEGAVTLAPDALLAIESYHWTGNVRELHDVLESALAHVRGDVLTRDLLPEAVRAASVMAKMQNGLGNGTADEVAKLAETTLAQTKREAEFARITQALEKHGHNRLRTASELGISRMTLYKKLYKYGIIEQEGRDGVLPSGRPRRMPASSAISVTEEDLSHQF